MQGHWLPEDGTLQRRVDLGMVRLAIGCREGMSGHVHGENGNHAVMRERPNDRPHELLVTRSSMAASRLVRGHRPADPGWASACNGAKGGWPAFEAC